MKYTEKEKSNEEISSETTEVEKFSPLAETDDSWIESLTDKTNENILDSIQENNEVPTSHPKRNYFNEVKVRFINMLNKCRQDNRSLISGFLVVSALTCMVTISIINFSNQTNLQPSSPESQEFMFQTETRPPKGFNRQTNNTINNHPYQQSSDDLTESQIEDILKYYFQQGSSSKDNAF